MSSLKSAVIEAKVSEKQNFSENPKPRLALVAREQSEFDRRVAKALDYVFANGLIL